MRETTKYFRDVLKASSQEIIDFKGKDYAEFNEEEIEKGLLSPETVTDKLNIEWKSQDEEIEEEREIIIATKTLCMNYEYLEGTIKGISELGSLLFIPARINKKGRLLIPKDQQMPWIPRDYLEPMCEKVLSFGKMSDMDSYYDVTDSDRSQIKSWCDYLEYARNLFSKVTNNDYYDDIFARDGKKYRFDGKYYVFLNDRVIASQHIIALYDFILDNKENRLYEKFTGGNIANEKPLKEINSRDGIIKHVGQMNGAYCLSPSQRNAMNHFVELEEGDILAISGPPGTGKTTLLQSIVATMYVERALKEGQAPIIVASSTNNQAVTNIIDSFGSINASFDENFERKWISGSNSFATFMTSGKRRGEAEGKGYQVLEVNGEGFFKNVESEENRTKAEKSFLTGYKLVFASEEKNISECKEEIHKCLLKVDNARRLCIDSITKISRELKLTNSVYAVEKDMQIYDNLNEKESHLKNRISDLDSKICQLKNSLELFSRERERLTYRMDEWNRLYYSIPWYIRLFSFIRSFKKRIENTIYSYMNIEEVERHGQIVRYETIIQDYKNIRNGVDGKILDLRRKISILSDEKSNMLKRINELERLASDFSEQVSSLYCILPKLKERTPTCEEIKKKSLLELNELLDAVRYIEFWLAVHYFEARWLETSNPLSINQMGKTFEKVLTTMYRRTAMLSPCFVMTFYMLPKHFKAYLGDNAYTYLDDLIDLLIVDEAGQTTLEVAFASFSLAKKAVVVGDENQIPPVYGVSHIVDKSIAIEKEVIKSKAEFENLKNVKMTCSSSSVMGRALLCCNYNEYEHGLFLSEHRRCYDEIIDYSNKLLYEGRLKPMRGTAVNENNKLLSQLQLRPMDYIQVDSETSETIGTSRFNKLEAEEIIKWIRVKYEMLKMCYQDCSENELLAIITPFKAQSNYIKKLLKTELPELADKVNVGTVHTFQGGEKKVIIFSSVYGRSEGYNFIRSNKNLMNVAVSRAKDAFIVFGDLRGFQKDDKTTDGLLREKVGFKEKITSGNPTYSF